MDKKIAVNSSFSVNPDISLPQQGLLLAEPNNLPIFNWKELNNRAHFVQFYEQDTYLINSIREFICSGDAAIVVATSEHRAKLEDGLKLFGLDLAQAHQQNQYICLDAAQTLAKFMVEGLPERGLFFEVMGGVIARAAVGHHTIRIFGEMVALLWAEGNYSAALSLEELWNELGHTFTFSLLCAYPINRFGQSEHAAAFAQICGAHSQVIPSENYIMLETPDERMRTIAFLQHKATALQAEIERRTKLERQKDEFIGMASHELKTPLTTIKGYVQLLERIIKETGNEKAMKYLAKTNIYIDRLNCLIADLLDASRIQVGKLQFNICEFDFDELVKDSVDSIQPTATHHQIEIVGKAHTLVTADRNRLEQVFSNLLTNAIKYSPQAHRVIVTVRRTAGDVEVAVHDFGIGISKEKQARIFEQFYRVESSAKGFSGLGIGLYISSEIINRHNGELKVESEEGKGSIFTFRLPISPALEARPWDE